MSASVAELDRRRLGRTPTCQPLQVIHSSKVLRFSGRKLLAARQFLGPTVRVPGASMRSLGALVRNPGEAMTFSGRYCEVFGRLSELRSLVVHISWCEQIEIDLPVCVRRHRAHLIFRRERPSTNRPGEAERTRSVAPPFHPRTASVIPASGNGHQVLLAQTARIRRLRPDLRARQPDRVELSLSQTVDTGEKGRSRLNRHLLDGFGRSWSLVSY